MVVVYIITSARRQATVSIDVAIKKSNQANGVLCPTTCMTLSIDDVVISSLFQRDAFGILSDGGLYKGASVESVMCQSMIHSESSINELVI